MKKIIWYILGISFLVTFAFGCKSTSGKSTKTAVATEFIVVGHRGFPQKFPENSLSGIEGAIAAGRTRVEIDVHQSKDGELIVMHDETLGRTSNGNGMIAKLTYKEISQFKLATKADPTVYEESIPTLDDVLKLMKGKAELLIEIKEGGDLYPGIEKRVVDLIKKRKGKDWCFVQSFSGDVLEVIHAYDPEIRLYRLWLHPYFKSPDQHLFVAGYAVNENFVSSGLVREMHAAGKELFVWTVNGSTAIAKMKALGVDGVISDGSD